MENLILSYKDKKIVYAKTKNGTRKIFLPLETDNTGKHYKKTIEQDSMGWKISSKSIEGDEFSDVWILDNKRICYNNNSNPDLNYLEATIDPDKEYDNPIFCEAQELYNVLKENIEKMIAFDNADWTPQSVIEMRRKQLAIYLKLLGYNGISDIRKKEEPSGEYAALSRVGEKLESYNGLDFVRRTEDLLLRENFVVDIPEFYSGQEIDPSQVIKKYATSIESVEKEIQQDSEFIEKRNEDLDRSRGILPDYFSNMKRKVKPEEWNTYHLAVIKIAKLVMGLNFDILPMTEREGISDLTRLSQEEVSDKISQFIDDVRFFDTAADIENRYATKESESFIGRVDELSDSSEAFQMGELAKSLEELKQEALSTRNEKKQKVEAYDKMNQLYENMTKIIIKTPRDKEEKD